MTANRKTFKIRLITIKLQNFIYGYMGNVLFNDALNTFYLRLYGIRHMVKDHSDSKKGNPLPPHTTAFVTAVVEHWLER